VELLELDLDRFRYSGYRNVSIGVWTQQATLEAAQRITRLSQRMIKLHPGGHSNVVFILDGAPAPTPEAQQEFAGLYDERNSRLACMAIIVEGGGFWASRMRSMITGMRLASPGSIKLRVHENIDELLAWFPAEHAERTGVALDPIAFREVLQLCHDNGTRDA
jgi:hypothetical protein